MVSVTILRGALLAGVCALLLASSSATPAPGDLLASQPSEWTLGDGQTPLHPITPKRVRYDGHQLVRLTPRKHKHVAKLASLLEDTPLDVWATTPTHVDVRVPPRTNLAALLRAYGVGKHVSHHVLVHDIEIEIMQPEWQHIDSAQQFSAMGQRVTTADPKAWFSDYHPFDDVVAWYKALAEEHPDRVQVIPDVGKSGEGRDIIAVQVTAHTNSSTPVANKKKFYIQGGIHAREWISHATTQYIAYNLATSQDETIRGLLNELIFVIVGIVNPDGYVWTWQSDRLWRKNRRHMSFNMYGVDLNRNFPANWGHGGSSKNPWSETYMGPSVASEPETQALIKLFKETAPIAGLDLHSYSQLILRPIGWERHDSLHEPQHKQLGDDMARIIESVHGKKYTSEKSIELYPTTGAASDWFYVVKFPLPVDAPQPPPGDGEPVDDDPAGSARLQKKKKGRKPKPPGKTPRWYHPYGVTIELRPSPEWWGPGFQLDRSEIIPTGEEILPAVLHFAKFALENPLYE